MISKNIIHKMLNPTQPLLINNPNPPRKKFKNLQTSPPNSNPFSPNPIALQP